MLPYLEKKQATGAECLDLGLSLHYRWELLSLRWGPFGITFRVRSLGRSAYGY